MKIVALLGNFLVWATIAHGQFDLHASLNYGFDAVVSNPALLQDHKLSIQLGATAIGGLTSTPLAQLGSRAGDRFILQPRQALLLPADYTNAYARYDITTLGVNLRTKRGQVGLYHRLRNSGEVNAPNDLVKLAIAGNEPLAGEQLDVFAIGSFTSWQEFGLHYARTFGRRLTLAARAKYLVGNVHAEIEQGNGSLLTDPSDFTTTYDLSFRFRTAGIPFDLSAENYAVNFAASNFGNVYGAGMDFGLVYRLSSKAEISASVQDIGAIYCADEGRVHQVEGTGSFTGVTGNVFEEGFAFSFDAVIADLRDNAGVMTRSEKYTSRLSPKLNSHFRYRFSDATDFTLTYNRVETEQVRQAFAVGVGQSFGDFLHVGLLAGTTDGYFTYGARASVMIAGIRVSASSDALAGVFDRYGNNVAHVRIGLSYNLGRIETESNRVGWFDDLPVRGRKTPDNFL